MTPTTNAVYAFGESPSRALDKINGALALAASKRIIDFNEGAQDSEKKKKFLNPALERIMDQKHDDSEDSQKKSI